MHVNSTMNIAHEIYEHRKAPTRTVVAIDEFYDL